MLNMWFCHSHFATSFYSSCLFMKLLPHWNFQMTSSIPPSLPCLRTTKVQSQWLVHQGWHQPQNTLPSNIIGSEVILERNLRLNMLSQKSNWLTCSPKDFKAFIFQEFANFYVVGKHKFSVERECSKKCDLSHQFWSVQSSNLMWSSSKLKSMVCLLIVNAMVQWEFNCFTSEVVHHRNLDSSHALFPI